MSPGKTGRAIDDRAPTNYREYRRPRRHFKRNVPRRLIIVVHDGGSCARPLSTTPRAVFIPYLKTPIYVSRRSIDVPISRRDRTVSSGKIARLRKYVLVQNVTRVFTRYFRRLSIFSL